MSNKELRQKIVHRRFKKDMLCHCLIIVFMLIYITGNSFINNDFKVMAESGQANNESEVNESQDIETIEHQEIKEVEIQEEEKFSEEERYMLAKIAMAEAEGSSIETKMCVIACVLNRVESKKFPNTIKKVLYANNGKVYQFSPIGNGRYDRVEPNQECYDAIDKLEKEGNDITSQILYFESCQDKDNWHSRNLRLLVEHGNMRFYGI